MKFKLVTVLAGLGLLAAGSLSAQVTNQLTIRGTVLEQNSDSSMPPLKLKFGTKDVLQLLQMDAGIDPVGAKLLVDDSGHVLVQQMNGDQIDVSGTLSVDGNSPVYTYKGNFGNTAVTEIGYGTATLTYNNGADVDISMTGASKTIIKDSKPDKNGNIKENQNHSVKGAAGNGTFDSTDATLTGSARATGKGTPSP